MDTIRRRGDGEASLKSADEESADPLSREPPAPASGRRYYFPDVTDAEWADWKWHYRHRVRDLDTLHRLLPYAKAEYQQLKAHEGALHIGIPPYYLSLIDPTDGEDPVRKQSVPVQEEFLYHSVGLDDPLREDVDMPVEGLVHRYPDRCLFIATNMCPMYCRHCTRRREWADGELPKSRAQLDAMVDYIRRTPQIRDVIFSGGDPLSLSLEILDYCIGSLRQIPHVEIVRVGTRYPVVLPQRITQEVADLLGSHHPLWVHTHFNHPSELTPEAHEACLRLLKAGVPMNNQSVLLRGVNDNAETMIRLCQGLLRFGIRPLYIFHCDPVRGAEHLRTSVWTGVEILEKMRGHTSSMAVPTYVLDTEGGGKVPLAPNYMLSASEDTLVLRNFQGRILRYQNPTPPAKRRSRGASAQTLPFRDAQPRKPRLVKRRSEDDADRPRV
jgi:lysine 2,3-aminomutase